MQRRPDVYLELALIALRKAKVYEAATIDAPALLQTLEQLLAEFPEG